MKFNRAKLAYYFDPLGVQIKLTPAAAMVDRAGQELKSLGLRLPSKELTHEIVPALPADFNLNTLFPDFAGIRLDGLFPDLKAPKGKNDKIKVTHGFDRDARRAWLQARIERLPIGGRCELFNIGPIAVYLKEGTFDATARIEAAPGQPMQKLVRGEIRGDWVLAVGGSPMVTFVDTPLTLKEDGKLKFGIEASKVQLNGALQFVDKFLSKFAAMLEDKTGLKISLIKDDGMPVGIDCLFDIALPPLSYGTFGISGMRFGAGMWLRAFPDFQIGARMYVGQAAKPFTLTVFVLGGAGYVQVTALYTPALREVRVDFVVEIGVSAMLGFSFGPIAGSVQIFLGIRAELHTRSRATTRFTLVAVIRVTGNVNVAGLISVSILLLLEAEVEGKRVTARGRLELTVKLGFLKKSFSVSVTYNLAGGSSAQMMPFMAGIDPDNSNAAFRKAAASWLATLD